MREIGEAFLGYHEDTCPAVIQHVCQEKSTKEGERDYDENKVGVLIFVVISIIVNIGYEWVKNNICNFPFNHLKNLTVCCAHSDFLN